MRSRVFLTAVPALWALFVPAVLCAQTIAPDTEFCIKLLVPINTQTSQKKDRITAQVLSPEQFQGDVMEGVIKESKSGGRVKGKSVISFTFDVLNHGGRAIPVQSSVKSVINSQGQSGVDEEGQIIRKKNNLGKTAAVAGLGAVIGVAVGGARGAAIGAGLGAAAALVFIEVAVQGANISFAPGSQFVLAVKERSRPVAQ